VVALAESTTTTVSVVDFGAADDGAGRPTAVCANGTLSIANMPTGSWLMDDLVDKDDVFKWTFSVTDLQLNGDGGDVLTWEVWMAATGPGPLLMPSKNNNTEQFGVASQGDNASKRRRIDNDETLTFTVANAAYSLDGGATNRVSGLTFDGFAGGDFEVGNDSATIGGETFDVGTHTEAVFGTPVNSMSVVPGAKGFARPGEINFDFSVVLAASPVIGVTPDDLDFGPILTNTTSDLILTITNSGLGVLNVTNVAFSGSNAFSVLESMPISVAVGSSTSITVRYSAGSSDATHTGTVHVWSDDVEASPMDVALRGRTVTDIEPDIAISTTSPLDFGVIAVTTTDDRAVTVINSGAGVLNVTNFTFSGADTGKFSVVSGTGAVGAEGVTSITVRYSPGSSAGNHSATLHIWSNDSDSNPTNIVLQGEAFVPAPDINIRTPSPLDFGQVGTSTTKTLAVKVDNTGVIDLDITNVTFSGTDTGKFSFVSGTGTIPVGGMSNLLIRFSPGTGLGTFSNATLHVLSNDPDTPSTNILLRGTGVASTPRPNIVLIYADDLGYTDLSCAGSEYYETPNIDHFATDAMVFTDAYAPAGNCAPSRAALLTGAYPPRTGIYTVNSADLGPLARRRLKPIGSGSKLTASHVTLAEALQANGYQTCHLGKWHLGGDPTPHGFDINIGGHSKGFPNSYFSPYQNVNLPDGLTGEHLPARLAEEACDWMETHKDTGPFFLNFCFYSPHGPWKSRYDIGQKYEAKPYNAEHFDVNYAGMVEAMDIAVGDILGYLDAAGLSSNTMVVFTSDNGTHKLHSNADPLRGGKSMLYEGGIREPFMVRCPGVTTGGTTNSTPVSQIDLYPTFLDYTSTEPPTGAGVQPLDGISLMPLLRAQAAPTRPIFWHFPTYIENSPGKDDPDSISIFFKGMPCTVMREGNLKLLEFFDTEHFELYDLSSDIGETNNLASTHPVVLEELVAKMQAWRTATEAPVPTELNPFWDPTTEHLPAGHVYSVPDPTDSTYRSVKGGVPGWWPTAPGPDFAAARTQQFVHAGSPKALPVAFANNGAGTLRLFWAPPIEIGGADSNYFSVASYSNNLESAANGHINLQLDTTLPGGGNRGYAVDLTIGCNDASDASEEVTVEVIYSNEPDIIAAPTALDFGTILTNTTSNLVVTADNVGSQPLSTTNFTFSGTNADRFSVVSGPGTVAVGASTNLTVRYTPGPDVGIHSATLHIWSDDPDSNPTNVVLTGTSLSSSIVTVHITDFGAANGGSGAPSATSDSGSLSIANTPTGEWFGPNDATDKDDTYKWTFTISNADLDGDGNDTDTLSWEVWITAAGGNGTVLKPSHKHEDDSMWFGVASSGDNNYSTRGRIDDNGESLTFSVTNAAYGLNGAAATETLGLTFAGFTGLDFDQFDAGTWSVGGDSLGADVDNYVFTAPQTVCTITEESGANCCWIGNLNFEFTVNAGGSPPGDGDGIDDAWELKYFSDTSTATDTSKSDTDPHTDLQEYITDTDPTDSNSYFRLTGLLATNSVAVYFDSSTGRVYVMQFIDDLMQTTWSNVPGQGPRSGSGANDVMIDTNDPLQRHYRIEVSLPPLP